ncbi:MAG: MnmC family methyltransferase [Bdellovibrionota bacterium]
MSLRALEPRETFHPGIGPVEEATVLHVQQQRLVERCLSTPIFSLWDIGLGAAANATAALRALATSELPFHHTVHVHSFDKTLTPLEFALDNAEALAYPRGYEKQIRELLSKGRVRMSPQIVWELHLGDFSQTVKDLHVPAPNAIFFDPYSPIGNPDMWTLETFKQLFARLNPEKTCLMTNYTRSTQARVAMLLAGFSVGIGCLVHQKDETTIASNDLEALERPLDRAWLEKRVRVSHNAAPLREAVYTLAPISEEDFDTLIALPQFRA